MAFEKSPWSSRNQPVLPSISALFGDVSTPLHLQRPSPWRAQSYPTQPEPTSLAAIEARPIARGPQLQPIISVKNDTVPPQTTWQIPSPSITNSRPSSVCCTDVASLDLSRLERMTDLPDIDYATIVQSAHTILESSQATPAYQQGWYQPCNEYNNRLEDKCTGKSLDDLVESFFFRDESRALYGDRVIIPRRPTQKDDDDSDPTSIMKDKAGQNNHRRQEELRRTRHRDLQHSSHERCAEIASECGAEHAKEEKVTRTQAGKGPGKDEQLYAAIYMQEMAGRLVQALNEKRKRAESVASMLLRYVQQQQQRSPCQTSPGARDTIFMNQEAYKRSSYVGMKRQREVSDGETARRNWARLDVHSDVSESRGSSFSHHETSWK